MSQDLTLARPYARAAFSLAREHGQLSQWSALLAFSAQAVNEPSVQAVLTHPRLQSQLLVEVLTPPEAQPVFAQFLSVLAENHRLAVLPEIAGLFDALRAEAEQVVKATITSARPVEAIELSKLRDSLKKRFGRDVEISTAVDASLIGGAVIDTGDVVIDGSIRTKLARMQSALAN